MLQQVMSQIAAVKKDMIILEKSEFSTLLAENEVGVFPFARPVAQIGWLGALCCFCGEPFFFFSFNAQKLKIQLFQLSVQLAVGFVFILFPTRWIVLSFHSREAFCVKLVCLACLCVTLLQDVMEKVRSDSLLDMNLEKSRVKELVSLGKM